MKSTTVGKAHRGRDYRRRRSKNVVYFDIINAYIVFLWISHAGLLPGSLLFHVVGVALEDYDVLEDAVLDGDELFCG